MSLINCPECDKQISDSATACPSCGYPITRAPTPTKSAPPRKRRGGFLIGIGALVLVVSFLGKNSDPGGSAPSASECTSDWTKCADNADLVNHYNGWSRVAVDCKYSANQQAKYGTPEWPWIPFGSFFTGTGYVEKGIAIAVEPDAQFQNGFGAMVHSRVTCLYDLKAKKVVSVSIAAK